MQFCEIIQDRLLEAYQLGPHRAIIGADIGVSHSVASGFDPEQLLSHADMALNVARTMAGKGYAAFSPDMDENLRARQELETEMQQAMERGEISLMFQPQAALEDGSIIGVEALMRWVHPDLGAVSPERFIPIAEETGKIVELGRWILEAACREVASWPGHLRLSVNVSPIQFELVDVVAEVKEALAKSGLPAHRLDIEITEGIFVSNARATIDALQKLRNLGVGIALDDFGTGYSSLSYLGRLPVDKIKIDQSFVRKLPGDQQAGVIIRAVMMLSEALDKVVIAEGIETADQAWMLKMMGCKVGQGYHFGRPRTGSRNARQSLIEQCSSDALRISRLAPNFRRASSASPSPTLPKASVSTMRACGNSARILPMIAGIWVEPPVRISVSMRSAPRPAIASVSADRVVDALDRRRRGRAISSAA